MIYQYATILYNRLFLHPHLKHNEKSDSSSDFSYAYSTLAFAFSHKKSARAHEHFDREDHLLLVLLDRGSLRFS